jgi:hypothetical protein
MSTPTKDEDEPAPRVATGALAIGMVGPCLALAAALPVAWGRRRSRLTRGLAVAIVLVSGVSMTVRLRRAFSDSALRSRRYPVARGRDDPYLLIRAREVGNQARFAPRLVADFPPTAIDRFQTRRRAGDRLSANQRTRTVNGSKGVRVLRQTTFRRPADRPNGGNWPADPIGGRSG